jgi:hypothetical protein
MGDGHFGRAGGLYRGASVYGGEGVAIAIVMDGRSLQKQAEAQFLQVGDGGGD